MGRKRMPENVRGDQIRAAQASRYGFVFYFLLGRARG
jgi:hypothetical protein